MSGIYIPGMKMPTRCWDCPMCYDMMACTLTGLNWYRDTVDLSIDPVEERMPNCPLIEIPPHGRLIDAGALRQAMYHEAFETDTPMQRWDSGCWILFKLFERMEEAAPTIIPAEGGIDNV